MFVVGVSSRSTFSGCTFTPPEFAQINNEFILSTEFIFPVNFGMLMRFGKVLNGKMKFSRYNLLNLFTAEFLINFVW
jgi:hypothetical protein